MMKRVLTFVFGWMLLILPAAAQDIDMSFVFVDKDGQVLENGATVVRNTVEYDEDGSGMINSGISVRNTNGSTDWLRVSYTVERIDNGRYQICFPSSCNFADEVGTFVTANGQLEGEIQNIQSEWFPVADGSCIVNLTIELMMKTGGFPPIYIFKGTGPSLTIKFVKGELPPEPANGDVNGDGEVNIADINAVIDMILSHNSSASGDVNGDGEVNIADVNALIDKILNN